MRLPIFLPQRLALLALALGLLALPSLSALPKADAQWVGTWGTSPMAEPAAKAPGDLTGGTLRQVVHVSLGGTALRIRISNTFGQAPLVLHGAHVALSAGRDAIAPGTDTPLLFGGRASVTVPAGASFVSDPVDFALPDQADLALSLHFARVPETLTFHGGSRTTSYFLAGDALAAPSMPEAARWVRWCFITGIEVVNTNPRAATLALLGDSITDGYGTTTDTNQRWPDELVRRLRQRQDLVPLGTLNMSIGGNRLLRDGNGPSALARLDRDILCQVGTRWLLVFIGINDLGTRLDARKKGADYASLDDLLVAYRQIIQRAKGRGLRVIGATITPYEGNVGYWCEDGEQDRQALNTWIRTSGLFDAVVDFDAALRDPEKPTRLAPAFDCGDHLHPSLEGYRRLAEAVPLDLFRD